MSQWPGAVVVDRGANGERQQDGCRVKVKVSLQALEMELSRGAGGQWTLDTGQARAAGGFQERQGLRLCCQADEWRVAQLQASALGLSSMVEKWSNKARNVSLGAWMARVENSNNHVVSPQARLNRFGHATSTGILAARESLDAATTNQVAAVLPLPIPKAASRKQPEPEPEPEPEEAANSQQSAATSIGSYTSTTKIRAELRERERESEREREKKKNFQAEARNYPGNEQSSADAD